MDNFGRGKWFYIHPTEQGGGKQGEMEVVCLSQIYQVALCCLLHHDLRQYCAPYNGCNAVIYSHTKESAIFVHEMGSVSAGENLGHSCIVCQLMKQNCYSGGICACANSL